MALAVDGSSVLLFSPSVSSADQGGGKRRAFTISYSSLNSLRVMDRSRAASRMPLCANCDQAHGGVVFVAQIQLCAHALKRDRNDADRFGLESCPFEEIWANRHSRLPGDQWPTLVR